MKGTMKTSILTSLTLCAILPLPSLTPGVVNTNVTAALLRSPKFIKAARSVPESEKREVFQRYGIDWSQRSKFEIDHYLPLCLGGMNTVSNLWPEHWNGIYGAHAKDRLEVYLHRKVNKGTISLQEAQDAFLKTSWTNSFVKYGLKPGIKTKLFPLIHKAVK